MSGSVIIDLRRSKPARFSMKADRLLSALLLLQARGRLTGRELAQRLEVSLRPAAPDARAATRPHWWGRRPRGAGGGAARRHPGALLRALAGGPARAGGSRPPRAAGCSPRGATPGPAWRPYSCRRPARRGQPP